MGLDLSEEFGSNKTAEKEGVWVSLGEEAEVKVARLGNPDAARAYRKIPYVIQKQIEDGTMGTLQGEQFLADFVSRHILKDWKGLDDAGKSLGPCTMDSAKKFCLKYRRFRERIWEISQDDKLFNIAEEKEEVKNS